MSCTTATESCLTNFHTSTSSAFSSFRFLGCRHGLGFFLTADGIIDNRIHEVHEQSQADIALAHGTLKPGPRSISKQVINGQLDETSESSDCSQSPLNVSAARASRLRTEMDLPSHDRGATSTITGKDLANRPKTGQSLAQHTTIEKS